MLEEHKQAGQSLQTVKDLLSVTVLYCRLAMNSAHLHTLSTLANLCPVQ